MDMLLNKFILALFLFSFPLSAFAQCKVPASPEWIQGASASVGGMTATVWRKDEDVSLANQTLEARLVLTKDDECLASFSGERKSGTAIVPWGDSKVGKFYFDSNTEFIRVSSVYHHGYIEEDTALFYYDSQKNALKKVWSETTRFIAHNGESDNHNIKVSENQLQLVNKTGQTRSWKWNNKQATFVEVK